MYQQLCRFLSYSVQVLYKLHSQKRPKNLHPEVLAHSRWYQRYSSFLPLLRCHYLLSLYIMIVNQFIIEPDRFDVKEVNIKNVESFLKSQSLAERMKTWVTCMIASENPHCYFGNTTDLFPMKRGFELVFSE
jgi:hypothetical protein